MGKLIFPSLLAIFGLFFITAIESNPSHLRGTFPLAKKREVTDDGITATTTAPATMDPLLAGIEDPIDRLNFLAYAEKLRLSQEKKKAKAAKAALKAQVKAGLLPPSALLTAPIVTRSLLNKRETEFVKELAKRYAPSFQEDYDESDADFKPKNKKHPHGHKKNKHNSHHGKGSGDDEPETSFEDDADADDTDSNTASSMEPISGAFNSFGAGPRKSPLNQAGCSGSHIHLCSGTTVYINSNDDTNTKTVQDPKADDDDEDEDENQTDDTDTDTDLRDAKWQRYWNRQRQRQGKHGGQGQHESEDSKKEGHKKNHKNKSKKHEKKNEKKEQESVEEEEDH